MTRYQRFLLAVYVAVLLIVVLDMFFWRAAA